MGSAHRDLTTVPDIPFTPRVPEAILATILQFAMSDRCADATLEDQSILSQVHRKFREGFRKYKGKGVEIFNAGTKQVNGWYRRIEAPPKAPSRASWSMIENEWRFSSKDPIPSYKKDDGCTISFRFKGAGSGTGTRWVCCDPEGNLLYYCKFGLDKRGWQVAINGSAPAPTS